MRGADGLGHQKFPTLLHGDGLSHHLSTDLLRADGLGHQKFPTSLHGDGLSHHLSTDLLRADGLGHQKFPTSLHGGSSHHPEPPSHDPEPLSRFMVGTSVGDGAKLCDILGPRGAKMSHTSPPMTFVVVAWPRERAKLGENPLWLSRL